MNILVVGLGSMGKRRIRLLKEILDNCKIVGVDSREDRRIEVTSNFAIDCYESIEEANKKENISYAFVCTSPLSHNSIISECLNNGWNVFSEINLVSDGYKKNIELAKEKGIELFLSSTFLYREEIQYIKNNINQDKKWNYCYHVGQYLPDWHPWENYNNFFVGDKRTSGCREILAIELPWIVDMFGNIKDVNIIKDKMSELKVDYEDNCLLQITHENGTKGVLVVDIVSPVAVRKLEIYSENSYYNWDGTPDSLYEFDLEKKQLSKVTLNEKEEHMEGYSQFIVENAYKNEIKEFFNVVNKKKKPKYGFEQDLKILELIDKVLE